MACSFFRRFNRIRFSVCGGGSRRLFSSSVKESDDFSGYTHLSTKAVQSGESGGRVSMVDCLTTPIAQTSAYTFRDTAQLVDFCESRYSSFEYGRYGNPTTKVLEDKLASMEGAEDCLFSTSSMSTNSSTLLALLPSGGHVMTTPDMCPTTHMFIQDFLVQKLGVTHTQIPSSSSGETNSSEIVDQILTHRPDVFFTQSPSPLRLHVIDVAAIAAACKEAGTLFIVDSTLATPIGQRALLQGANVVTHSASSYLGGHNDVMAGAICGSSDLVGVVRKLHAVLGGVLDPHAAYLVIRGIKTLGIRFKQQSQSALAVANYLSSVPQIEDVFYTALPSHPDWDVSQTQLQVHGGVVSFIIKGGKPAACKFIDALRIPYISNAYGGVESLVMVPSITGHYDRCNDVVIPEGLVRLSCGLEDNVDLLTDIANALKAAS